MSIDARRQLALAINIATVNAASSTTGGSVAADVVIGIDRQTEREFTVYGMPSLETTTLIRQPSAMQILRVIVDCNNQELDRLLVLVRDAKGLDSHKHAKA